MHHRGIINDKLFGGALLCAGLCATGAQAQSLIPESGSYAYAGLYQYNPECSGGGTTGFMLAPFESREFSFSCGVIEAQG